MHYIIFDIHNNILNDVLCKRKYFTIIISKVFYNFCAAYKVNDSLSFQSSPVTVSHKSQPICKLCVCVCLGEKWGS